jgi:hypothetical protein
VVLLEELDERLQILRHGTSRQSSPGGRPEPLPEDILTS